MTDQDKIHVDLRELPSVLEAVVLGPEDRLVLVFPRDFTADQFVHVRSVLAERGWDDSVLVVAGVEELAVLRAAVQS